MALRRRRRRIDVARLRGGDDDHPLPVRRLVRRVRVHTHRRARAPRGRWGRGDAASPGVPASAAAASTRPEREQVRPRPPLRPSHPRWAPRGARRPARRLRLRGDGTGSSPRSPRGPGSRPPGSGRSPIVIVGLAQELLHVHRARAAAARSARPRRRHVEISRRWRESERRRPKI